MPPPRPTPADLPAMAKTRPWLKDPQRPAPAWRVGLVELAILLAVAYSVGLLTALVLR